MKKYRVEFLSEAKQDIEDIRDYIAVNLENKPAAIRIVQAIIDKCESLAIFPNGYAIKFRCDGRAVRFAHCGRYTIAFLVGNDTVTVYAIKYSRSDLNAIL